MRSIRADQGKPEGKDSNGSARTYRSRDWFVQEDAPATTCLAVFIIAAFAVCSLQASVLVNLFRARSRQLQARLRSDASEDRELQIDALRQLQVAMLASVNAR